VPASIGRRGIREIVELDLDEAEHAKFDASVATLQGVIAASADVLPAPGSTAG
jgi:L-lactate dehydrogenase